MQPLIGQMRDEPRTMRSLTGVVLFFFLWLNIHPAVAATKEEIERQQKATHSQRLKALETGQTLDSLRSALVTATGRTASPATLKRQLKALRLQLESEDKIVMESFQRDLEHIKKHRLPDLIQQRHAEAVQTYQRNRNTILQQLKGLDIASSAQLPGLAQALLQNLDAQQPKPISTFDPKNLPFRVSDSKARLPKTKAEDLRNILKPNLKQAKAPLLETAERKQAISPQQLASLDEETSYERYQALSRQADVTEVASLNTNSLLAVSIPTPGPEFLAPTEDVQITPEIQQKAQELNNHPVEIYNWVRNTIDYIPTYGGIQGSQMTLDKKAGNAFDTASLLIALLRAAGIPARYVYGTVDIPAEKVANWIGGLETPDATANLLGQGGIPHIGLTQGGQIKAFRLEHMWVEALVDFYPSKGAKNLVPDAWVPMDAGFKQYGYVQPQSVEAIVPFDAQSLISNAQTTSQSSGPDYTTGLNESLVLNALEEHRTRLAAYVEQERPNATVGDFFGSRRILPINAPTLASGLPFGVVAKSETSSALPENLRHQITLEFFAAARDIDYESPTFVVERPLSGLTGRRIGFVYEPSTADDKMVLDSAQGNYRTNFQAYAVNMRPSLKIEDTAIATGGSYPVGTDQILRITLTTPWYQELRDYRLRSGDHMVLVLNPSGVTLPLLEARSRTNDLSDGQDADLVSETFYQVGLSYWAQEEAYSQLVASRSRVVTSILPSHGLAGSPITVSYRFGVPHTASYRSRTLDVKSLTITAEHFEGDLSGRRNFATMRGYLGSYLEAGAFDQAFLLDSGFSMSSVTALRKANQLGVTIFKVTPENAASVLPQLQLDPDTMSSIGAAISAGLEVIAPQSDIQVASFTGAGYIINDPVTGAGSYIISGGRNGNSSPSGQSVYPLPQFPATIVAGVALSSALRDGAISLVVRNGLVTGFLATQSLVVVGAGGAAGGAAIGVVAPLVALLAVASALAQANAQSIEEQYPRTSKVYRHYTPSLIAPLIDASKTILSSAGDPPGFGRGVYFEAPPDANISCPMSSQDTSNIMYRYNIDGPDRDAFIEVEITRSGYWDPVIEVKENDRGGVETIFRLLFVYYGPFSVAIQPHSECY